LNKPIVSLHKSHSSYVHVHIYLLIQLDEDVHNLLGRFDNVAEEETLGI